MPFLGRTAGFLALWVVLIGTDPVDVAAGVVPALAAAWASVVLLPPGDGVRFAALPGYALRFLRQSVAAGWDVARRAFAPSLAVRPGYAQFAPRRLRGDARQAFASVTSLLPGTVPVAEDEARIEYHCLDAAQPVAAQLADEERAFARLVRVE
jgi:multicomponent Na+:H+ antiporter subunit E